MLHVALASFASLVAIAFSMSTFERWLAKRRRHELAWSVSLAFFALASLSLAAGAALGWNDVSFRLFYLFGAIVNVPFLALGTIYLLGGEKRGDRWGAFISLLSAFAAGVVVTAPLKADILPDELVKGSEVFGVLPRALAATCSGVAALVIFGGALWSAWRYRRGRMLWANLLIAAGTLLLSSSGLFNSVLGEMDAFAVTLALGITVIFLGFLVATGGAPAAPRLQAVPVRNEAPGGAASRPSPVAAQPRR
ncbi:MAG TPA: hypothetical protein VM345_02400 [Acidimicrobiales bacterium]|nr:hypothetical protein [Acidimicrobiales bacterium]